MNKNSAEMIYESAFGVIPLGPEVPLELVKGERRQRLDQLMGAAFDVGACNYGLGTFEVRPDHDESGNQIGWIDYLSVPFSGNFLHELRRRSL